MAPYPGGAPYTLCMQALTLLIARASPGIASVPWCYAATFWGALDVAESIVDAEPAPPPSRPKASTI